MQRPILVLAADIAFGSDIARTLRLQHIYAIPLDLETPAGELEALDPHGAIWATPLLGVRETSLPDLAFLRENGVPVLALGDLATMLCVHFGGQQEAALPDFQAVTLGLTDSPLLGGISGGERMLSHLSSLSLPEGLSPLATATEQCIGFTHNGLPLYALEYPIERNDPDGSQLLFNFAHVVCGAPTTWNSETFIQLALAQISEVAGEDKVLCAISGGIDSAVSAKLAHMAVGDRLQCLFIDTGLLRQGEAQEVLSIFRDTMGLAVTYVDESKTFLRALDKVPKAQDKDRITNELLQQLLQRHLSDNPYLKTLVLGTHYNDALYHTTALPTAQASTPPTCQMVEPLRLLFKEEVRRLGSALSLPADVVNRQSFPLSGLALRLVGEVTPDLLARLRLADALFQEEILAGGHEKKLWQYYATLLQTPGEGKDYTVVLRALQAAQGQAYAARLPYDLLERTTSRLCSEVEGVAHVVYDLTPNVHYNEQE